MRIKNKNIQKFTECTLIHKVNFCYFTANSTKFLTDKSEYNDWQHQGTKELAHLEMVGTIVHQLTDGVCPEELEKAGLGAYYTDHGVGL